MLALSCDACDDARGETRVPVPGTFQYIYFAILIFLLSSLISLLFFLWFSPLLISLVACLYFLVLFENICCTYRIDMSVVLKHPWFLTLYLFPFFFIFYYYPPIFKINWNLILVFMFEYIAVYCPNHVDLSWSSTSVLRPINTRRTQYLDSAAIWICLVTSKHFTTLQSRYVKYIFVFDSLLTYYTF